MNRTVDWLNDTLEDIRHEVFKDVVRILDSDVKPIGDGQVVIFSDINRVTLILETSSGENRKLQAISKLDALSKQAKEFASSCDAYTTETMMYSDILKSMEKLMLEVGDKNLLWPLCYHCSDNGKLLLQDLSIIDYKIVPTYLFLDIDHALLVMKNIGKFHGLSMALHERGMLTDNHYGMPYYARKDPFMEAILNRSINDLCKIIKEKWGPKWSSVPDRLLKYFENTGEKLHEAWISSKGRWAVLNHGDFSMRNMMFHYQQGSASPDTIKFVDFQMSHFCSLGNDLVMFLYGSLKPSVREKNMKILLETYLEGLSKAAQVHKYKGRLPTIADVEESMRSLRILEAYTILLSIPMFVRSGKTDMQKETDGYLNALDTSDDMVQAHEKWKDVTVENMFDDEDVTNHLKDDFERLMNHNVF